MPTKCRTTLPLQTPTRQANTAALAALDQSIAEHKARQQRVANEWQPCTVCLAFGYDRTLIEYESNGETRTKPKGWHLGHRHARPDQLPPPGMGWDMWFAMAGRGWGKTRSGAEECVRRLLEHPNTRGFILTPRLEDSRTVAAEGESGLLAVLREHGIEVGIGKGMAKFNRSTVELWLPNGSYMKGFGGRDPDSPEAFRGPQWHFGWIDEPGSIRYGWQCLQMARLGLRLSHAEGDTPQLIVTGTPRRVGLVRQLVKEIKAKPLRNLMVNGRTADNAGNLATNFVDTMNEMFAGTALGSQELDGILLDDVEGALWRKAWIDRHRCAWADLPLLRKVVVSIDPAASNKESADEVGIILLGLGVDDIVYVIGDETCRGLPSHWTNVVIEAAQPYLHPHTLEGVVIVVEDNLIPEVMLEALAAAQKAAGTSIPVRRVHASESKETRAEPVSMLYDIDVHHGKPRVRHVGFPNYEILDGKAGTKYTLEPGELSGLEDECTSWVPSETKKSPNRIDALVWGISFLCFGGNSGTAALAYVKNEETPAMNTMLTKALEPASPVGTRGGSSMRQRAL